MGILDTFFPSKTTTTTTGGEYIPANDTAIARTGNAIRDSGAAALNKVTDIYKANPKKFQLLGVLAGAAILAGMKNRAR